LPYIFRFDGAKIQKRYAKNKAQVAKKREKPYAIV
jgi:hypothetical protein